MGKLAGQKEPAVVKIRKTNEKDIERLAAIERSADRAFLSLPTLAWVANDGVMPVETHRRLIAEGFSIVAVDQDDTPVGFLSAECKDGEMHILGLAVEQGCQGQGVGTQLLSRAIEDAKQEHRQAITLTTFRDVAWNQGFYERNGFKVLDKDELSAQLKEILLHEIEHGFLAETRCAMQLSLPKPI
ncbi:GNAT family N-acetyltransferase [Dryocola sp. BD586]|jgi:ribosomal protein S18 acetylase RimI-like enzyme|uniref:GNAT family N-acetyltransferase n=1 Tax=Dryocola sp. BD586 TaxID=3133271 RepID=UPI003F5026DB